MGYVPHPLIENHQKLFPQQESNTDTFKRPVNDSSPEMCCGRICDSKALGLNDIPNKALKVPVTSKADIFTDMFEILLPKVSKPPGKSSPYRPMYLLDTMRRMWERLIYKRLLPVVENQGGLSDRQWGFQKSDSALMPSYWLLASRKTQFTERVVPANVA